MDSQTTTPDPGGDRASKKSVAVGNGDNRKYSTHPARCNTCGQRCRSGVCRQCAGWMRVYHYHVAMSAALTEAHYG